MRLMRASILLFVGCAISLIGLSPPVAGQEAPEDLQIKNLEVEPSTVELIGDGNGTVTVSFDIHNCGTASRGDMDVNIGIEPPWVLVVYEQLSSSIGPDETIHLSYGCDISSTVAAGTYNVSVSIFCPGVKKPVQKHNITIKRLKPAEVNYGLMEVSPHEITNLQTGQKARFQIQLRVFNEGDLNGTVNVSIYYLGNDDSKMWVLRNWTISVRPRDVSQITLNWSTTRSGRQYICAEIASPNGTVLFTVEDQCRVTRTEERTDGISPLMRGLALPLGIGLVIIVIVVICIIILATGYKK